MEETRKNEPDGQPAKEKKHKRELSPKEVQQRKKMIVFPLMFLAFAGCMYLIFAPSGKDKTDVESVGGFNAQTWRAWAVSTPTSRCPQRTGL